MNAQALQEASVEIMNKFIELKGSLNDSSMTMKEFSKLKPVLIRLDNLINDIVEISINIKEK